MHKFVSLKMGNFWLAVEIDGLSLKMTMRALLDGRMNTKKSLWNLEQALIMASGGDKEFKENMG